MRACRSKDGSDRYEFDPGHRAEIEAKLARLAEDDEAASSAERAFTFYRPGNAMHKSWDNTIVGRAILRAGVLVLETNSIRRADDLRTKVEGLLGTPSRARPSRSSSHVQDGARSRGTAART